MKNITYWNYKHTQKKWNDVIALFKMCIAQLSYFCYMKRKQLIMTFFFFLSFLSLNNIKLTSISAFKQTNTKKKTN